MRIRSGLIPLLGIVTSITVVAFMGLWAIGQLNAEAPPEVPYLGIRFSPMDPLGVRIDEVLAGSPAQAAGLMPGDIVYTLDGTYIDATGLLNQIQERTPADVVELGVQRSGVDHHIDVQLTDRPASAPAPVELISVNSARASFRMAGATTVMDNGYWRVTELDNAGLLSEVGLHVGDVITHIDGVDVAAAQGHRLATSTLVADTVHLTLQREDESVRIEAPATVVRMMVLDAVSTPVFSE